MKNSLLYTLGVLLLIVPSISRTAAVEVEDFSKKVTPITWINDTGLVLAVVIISTNSEYEISTGNRSVSKLKEHSNYIDATVKGYGPYKVSIRSWIVFLNNYKHFTIPTITGPTDIRITENPTGSKNFEVWYRPSKTIEGREQALAVMEATHPRLGAGAPAGGGEIGSSGRYETYKQIAEHLLPEPWKKAERLK